MRLIDADELIEKNAIYSKGFSYVHTEDIADAPTIEAEPIKHGRWEHYKTEITDDDIMGGEHEFKRFRCSICGYDVGGNSEFHYCPKCGAKMDGKENDG